MKLIDKDALVAEIEKLQSEIAEEKKLHEDNSMWYNGINHGFNLTKDILDTLEVKEVDLELTWEDMRELYIIFAEVDTEIELCKTCITAETIGYYQEVLKRFKERKGEVDYVHKRTD